MVIFGEGGRLGDFGDGGRLGDFGDGGKNHLKKSTFLNS